MLTQERLKSLLHYDEKSGLFIRKVGKSGPKARIGDFAGCNNGQGYSRIYVDGKAYKGHQLAWLYMFGDWAKEIDHINGKRSDNRKSNLRSVTRKQNRTNCGAYRNNTSGYKGVSLDRVSGKWKAQIQFEGKKTSLGLFDAPEAAHAAYTEAAKRLHGEYARAA